MYQTMFAELRQRSLDAARTADSPVTACIGDPGSLRDRNPPVPMQGSQKELYPGVPVGIRVARIVPCVAPKRDVIALLSLLMNWMGMDVKTKFLNTATIRITPEILSLIAEIDEFKGGLSL